MLRPPRAAPRAGAALSATSWAALHRGALLPTLFRPQPPQQRHSRIVSFQSAAERPGGRLATAGLSTSRLLWERPAAGSRLLLLQEEEEHAQARGAFLIAPFGGVPVAGARTICKQLTLLSRGGLEYSLETFKPHLDAILCSLR